MSDHKCTALGGVQIADLRAALQAADLPFTDLDEVGRQFYRFDFEPGGGYAGLEGTGPDRLLRSVLIDASVRGRGLGGKLVGAIEDLARAERIERLHLLTTSAASFFEQCGYRIVERREAPPAIAASHEFTRLCPASAAYLVKSL